MLKMVEVKGEGLASLLGQEVILFCSSYFYAGKLEGVNKTVVKLTNPRIVYETGPFSDTKWRSAESMGVSEVYVRIPAIEAYALGK